MPQVRHDVEAEMRALALSLLSALLVLLVGAGCASTSPRGPVADTSKLVHDRNGQTVTWIYNSYYERYDGTHHAGYHRQVYFDPYLRSYRVHYRPVLVSSYVEEKEERIRVVFKDGKATVIEQTRD